MTHAPWQVRAEQSDSHVFQIGCSYMEIYGRELRDLLNPKAKEEAKEKLKIRNGKQGTCAHCVAGGRGAAALAPALAMAQALAQALAQATALPAGRHH